MAQPQIIVITPLSNPTPEQMAQFCPQTQEVAPGDIVFWQNNDECADHQPKPTHGADDDWTDVLPTKLPNKPAPTSQRTVTFSQKTEPNPDDPDNPTPVPYSVTYVCALHSDETGTINITAE